MLNQDDAIREAMSANDKSVEADMPIGARIIRVVWDFVSLTTAVDGRPAMSPQEAMRHLRGNQSEAYDQETLDALENVLDSSAEPRGEKVVASIS